MGDASEVQVSKLPQPQLTVIQDGVWQLLPLSRKGSGPGLIVLTPESNTQEQDLAINHGIPSPLIKWAEESYTVVQVQSSFVRSVPDALSAAVQALAECSTVDNKGRYGLIVYDAPKFSEIQAHLAQVSEIVAAVVYTDGKLGTIETKLPTVQHLAGKVDQKLPRTQHLTAHSYPSAKSPGFALPTSTDFDYAQEAVSHTRSLTFLKHHTNLGGPIFDLEEIWEEHTYYEFADRDVAKTMATMVQEPYVNHVPTLTGGIGRANLTDFYTHHFIFANADDAELELISRTTGVDRVVDEFIFKFTHDRVVDWILPAVPPTGRTLEVPMMAVVNIRGDRLYHEHISWDQATVLRQIGLLPEYLSWPVAGLGVPGPEFVDRTARQADGVLAARIPVGGVETASKLRDKNAAPSNLMFDYKFTYGT